MIRENHLFAAEEEEMRKRGRREKKGKEEEMEFGAHIARSEAKTFMFSPKPTCWMGYTGGKRKEGPLRRDAPKLFPAFPFLA